MVGTTISHYRVLRQIGRGGMGVVYEAQDLRLGRHLALKFLPEATAADPAAWERFQREARTLSGLNHPHILTVYDVGREAGRDFIATELIEGSTLRERLAQGPLQFSEAEAVARQILEAMKTAHAAGIVHRDLKPENIMIRTDGYVKVLDFGVAKLLASDPGGQLTTVSGNLTVSGELVGTALYMAPEQVVGQAADARSDLFAVGIVLYEMLTGKHPWERKSALETLHAILHEQPDKASLDAAITPIVSTALQKNPADRFQSAGEMLTALQDCTPRKTTASAIAQPSIAVLPFSSLGGVEDKQALSLGFADALITALGNLKDLVVRPTSSIIGWTEAGDPLRAARELHVRYVLHGTIQKVGSEWRVSVQLFDVDVNRIIFSQKYDFALASIFAIQDEISGRVATALQTRLGAAPEGTSHRYSKNTQAYSEYMQGLRASYGDARSTLERAAEFLSSAVSHDAQFALAHAMLSHVSLAIYFGHDPRRHWLAQAEVSCRRALELDADLAEALMAKAFIVWSPAYNFQHREALGYLQQALARQPNLDHALNRLGTICSHIGHMAESRAAYSRARDVNPFSQAPHNIAQTYLWEGEWKLAAEECDRWLAGNPENKNAWWIYPQPALLSGDIANAKMRMTDALHRVPPDPLMTSLEGLVYAWAGDRDRALECVRRSCESAQSFGHNHHTYYQIACVYARLEDVEQAMSWLERAANTGFPCWTFFAIDPSLQKLVPSPRFQELISSLETEFRPVRIEIP